MKKDDRVQVLLLTGGEIHDHKGVGDILEATLREDARFSVTRVENDLNVLAAPGLDPFDVLVFYWTLGELAGNQREGLLSWVASGRGFVTLHSGADSFRGDPLYRGFVGGYFVTHPHYRTYQVSVSDSGHPITQGIEEFMTTDEQYIVSYDSRNHVLAWSLYKGERVPVLWVKDWGKGRVFYCALGHDPAAAKQEMTRMLLVRGVAWAASQPA